MCILQDLPYITVIYLFALMLYEREQMSYYYDEVSQDNQLINVYACIRFAVKYPFLIQKTLRGNLAIWLRCRPLTPLGLWV
jgi:hypothetical protein